MSPGSEHDRKSVPCIWIRSTAKPNAQAHEVTEADLETLWQNVPIFAFLEKLPDSLIDGIEAASEQICAERFTLRR